MHPSDSPREASQDALAPSKPSKPPLPPIPPNSLLHCMYPPTGVPLPRGRYSAIAYMVRYRMYGSSVISLPLIAIIATGIQISVSAEVGDPSPYAPYFTWLLYLCIVLLIAHTWSFIRALRRVRRHPAQPEVLLRALKRGPLLVLFFTLVVLSQYLLQPDKRDTIALWMAVILATLAALTQAAVFASMKGRITHDAAREL